MATEESVTITETAPDGTETTVEITTTKDDDSPVGENGESLVEEVIEALFDVDIGDDSNLGDARIAEDVSPAELELTADESDTEAGEIEFTEGDEMFAPDLVPADVAGAPVADVPVDTNVAPVDPTYSPAPAADPFPETGETAAAGSDDASEAEAAELAEQEAHAEAAREAQAAADEFVAAGDYEAASQAREVAENEAWEAGDSSMLDGSDSTDLDNAAYKQDVAEDYERQEAAHAQQGDYEAAKEDAGNAAYATQDADFQAGGADHSGQAQAEENQMDWAVWEEGNADYYAKNAEAYAAEGNLDAAQRNAEEAGEHQERADYHGDLGEHGGDVAVYDPSSDVDSGGAYDATVDTGYDAGVDATVDTSTDTGYDSGGGGDY